MIKKPKNGFTLIELLVAIAIIGLLASIVTVSVNSARAKARDGKRHGEANTLRTALELYYADNDKYPTATGWIKIEEDADINGPFAQAMQPHLPTIPADPLYPKVDGEKIFSYQYISTEDQQGYKIHIEMETGIYASHEVYLGEGSEIIYGEDQAQLCIDNSSVSFGWIIAASWEDVDKSVVWGLANDCSGLLLTVILSEDLQNDGCGVGVDSELGMASSIIPNDGDDQNKTTVDFVPDIPIEPVECVGWDVS
ncbi:MAG: prepilin-type N-terminal cleavage/methylation domain-containing protein [Patescibacteria group bacterium]